MTIDELERIVSEIPNGLTAGQKEEWLVQRAGKDYRPVWREHKYRTGNPPARLRHMQLAHETRARKAGVVWDMVDLRTVYAKDSGICGICKRSVDLSEFTIDHIKPISKGGPHILENLQIAHWTCNVTKGDQYDG